MCTNEQILSKLESLINKHSTNANSDYRVLSATAANDSENTLTKEEVAYLALTEINNASTCKDYYSIQNSFIVSDFSGNKYLYTRFNPCGSSITSMYNYETVEVNFFDQADYSSYTDDSNLKYIPTAGLYEWNNKKYENAIVGYSFPEENSYVATETSQFFSEYMNENYITSLNQKASLLSASTYSSGGGGTTAGWVVDINTQEVKADVEVPYSWFFKYNNYQFSYKGVGSGICEYIAFLLMAQYHDFFKCAGYLSQSEINTYITSYPGSNLKEAIPVVSDNWCYDLYIMNNKKESLNTGDLDNLAKKFMNGKTAKYSLTSGYWLFNKPKNVIGKGARPDMLCGMLPNTTGSGTLAHNVVAYGYYTSGAYKDKFLTHYGWHYGCSQCIISQPFASGYDWSFIDKNPEHIHRFIFNVSGVMTCGCGVTET